jgi:hypothetical protein
MSLCKLVTTAGAGCIAESICWREVVAVGMPHPHANTEIETDDLKQIKLPS